MKNVLVVGSFGYITNQLDGQTIKTRQVYKLLKDNYKDGKVDYFCTQILHNNFFYVFRLFYKIFKSKTIIAVYASSGGYQTIVPLLYYITSLLSKNLIYIAIGSTQVDCLEGTGIYSKPRLRLLRISKRIHAFLAETQKVKRVLEEKYLFKNVDLFPNFREYDKNISFSPSSGDVLKLVFMARVTPQKGYHVIFEFLDYIKDKNYNIIIDFFGPMDGVCNKEFLSLIDSHKDQGVRYKGVLAPEEIYSTLTEYDVLLFPTMIDGIPGSIIDAYISSLAVVATNWEFAHEIIDNGETGFIVSYDNPRKQLEFNECLIKLYNDRKLLNEMKYKAYKKRLSYSCDAAWNVLNKYL